MDPVRSKGILEAAVPGVERPVFVQDGDLPAARQTAQSEPRAARAVAHARGEEVGGPRRALEDGIHWRLGIGGGDGDAAGYGRAVEGRRQVADPAVEGGDGGEHGRVV